MEKNKKSKKYKEIVEKYRNDEIERREFEEYLDRLVGCTGVTLDYEPTPAENCMAFDFEEMEWFNPSDFSDA